VPRKWKARRPWKTWKVRQDLEILVENDNRSKKLEEDHGKSDPYLMGKY